MAQIKENKFLNLEAVGTVGFNNDTDSKSISVRISSNSENADEELNMFEAAVQGYFMKILPAIVPEQRKKAVMQYIERTRTMLINSFVEDVIEEER